MKILAVRGENLASLPRFEIDFLEEAFSGPLFAITGPTGAGKSTILDAICLPLFDRTPRRGGKQKTYLPDVGSSKGLGASDVRGILRKGTSSGFAELDFVGMDRVRYRARWSVRRSRDRADGRLQEQEISLSELESGRRIGDKKKDVLERIKGILGLSFEQFCRSVLLAQGDFAAFLEADASERADLLERMTGTELYGELSTAVYERAQKEKQGLLALEQGAGDEAPMGEEARAELERGLLEGRGRLAALEAEGKRFEAYEAAKKRGEELLRQLRDLDASEGEAQKGMGAAQLREGELDRELQRMDVAGFVNRQLEFEALLERKGQLETAVERVQRWKGEHDELRVLARDWTAICGKLEERERVLKGLAGLLQEREAGERALREKESAIEEAKKGLREIGEELAKIEKAEQELRARADAERLGSLQRAKAEAEEEKRRLDACFAKQKELEGLAREARVAEEEGRKRETRRQELAAARCAGGRAPRGLARRAAA